MQVLGRVSPFLWLAVVGAITQIVALTGNFYDLNGEARSAWFGIPHTSDLILLAAILALLAAAVTAIDRAPFSGRRIGLIVGAVGTLAALQLGYRMIVPPFGCLQFGCGLSGASDATLLGGIWVALGGCVAVALGGFAYAFSERAKRTEARPPIAEVQSGMTPWLGLAALGSVAMFVFPFTVFTLYTVSGFMGAGGTSTWGGWLSTPHTSSLILGIAVIIVGLVIAAARERSPLVPRALGLTIAALATVGGGRLLYRVIDHPFAEAGGASGVQVGNVTTELPGYLGLAGALLAVIAAAVYVVEHRGPKRAAAATESPPSAA